MLVKQFFDSESSTYTYLIAAKNGQIAAIIDPVKGNERHYIGWLIQNRLRLGYAFDTHTHADHITALGDLRNLTGCTTIMSEHSHADCVSRYVTDGEFISVDGLTITAIYTPGHTSESMSYLADGCVFTGDTLLINGTGRTDFQSGDAEAQYDSLFNKLLRLPDETVIYPGHDYHGRKSSTIAEERINNPRLQVNSAKEYAALMASLDLPDPKLMDVAVPLNLSCGQEPKRVSA